MADRGLFSDSEEEQAGLSSPPHTDPDEPSDFEQVGPGSDESVEAEGPRQVRDRMDRVILVTPPMPVSTAARHNSGGGGGREWNAATRHVPSQQRTCKAHMARILLGQTRLSGNMIRGILELTPPEYSGRQTIPDAHSSIFKVHIHNNQMGLILLRSGQLYAMDLRTGQFWHNDRDYSVLPQWNRVRAAAFHPTKPLVMVHAWHTTTMSIVRYPTTLRDHTHRIKVVEVGAISSRGLSTTSQAAATLHVGTRAITFHEFPATDEDLLTTGFAESTALPRLSQGAPIFFAKLVQHSTAAHTFQLVWQTLSGQQRPLRLETLTNGTRSAVHFYGPTSTVYDADLSGDKMVAMTEKHAIFVWRHDGTHLKTFRKHYGILQSMSLSGSMLATASFDKSVRIWNMDTLQLVQSGEALRHAHTGKKKPQAVALWNNRIVIGFEDKSVEVFRLS